LNIIQQTDTPSHFPPEFSGQNPSCGGCGYISALPQEDFFRFPLFADIFGKTCREAVSEKQKSFWRCHAG